MKANQEIRDMMKSRGLSFWQVAARIGIHEKTLIAWFRLELTGERKAKVLDAINQITN